MTIQVGDKLPQATLFQLGENGPAPVEMSDLAAGRKIVIFALPGAYTGTCSTAHVPSFMRTRAAFADKGVDAVYCVSVNDPFVMGAWGKDTGATEAGITMLADPDGSFTKAMGTEFDIAPLRMLGRSKRYALLAEDGEVKVFQMEDNSGQCTVSGGESLLEAI